MSHFLDRLMYFSQPRESFAGGHGVVTGEDRTWEESYRTRWQHDKIVRSTHGTNCTGSCSWKIYVKGGIVTWETQQTDYPRTRADLPNHEPRGCSRGASYSWYLYSGNRLKYPMVRGRLLALWRTAREKLAPVEAWASIVEDAKKLKSYQSVRGMGGFVRASWDEVNEIVAAANVYTVKKYGPDRVIGFSPIPAMSMVSYAAGSRYLSLIGGVCMSFYDWYCDLPPSSPQTWGEQTDVPESADWYNSTYIIAWGSNVPQTRTPDAHFFTEVRYKGAKTVSVTPDYSEVAKLTDLWLHPKQGTDAALAMAMGHVILKEFHLPGKSAYFEDYCRRYTDMPMLVRLAKRGDVYVPERFVRASDFADQLGESNNPDWKTVALDETSGKLVSPQGAIGYRWGEKGKWNLEPKDGKGAEVRLRLTLAGSQDEVVPVAFPYFGGQPHEHFTHSPGDEVLKRNLAVKRVQLKDGECVVATVFDLFAANYGLDRGLGGGNVAHSYDDDVPYTPAWQEKITGVPRAHAIQVAREFADNADKTQGRVHGDHRRGDEPLVPHGHELSRHHQHAGDVRLRRADGRRLGALRRAGEAAPADRLDPARVRARLGAPAAADELDLVLLRAHRPVALRAAEGLRDPLAARRPEAIHREPHRLQRARRAHGLAAFRAAARRQSAAGRQGRRGRRQGPEGLRRRAAEERRVEALLRGPGQSGELPAQSLRVALEPPRLLGQGPRVFPQALPRHPARRAGQGPRRDRRREARGSRLARPGPGRKAGSPRDARLPHVDDLPLLGRGAPDRYLVREERPQHLRHASLHPSALRGGGPCLAVAERLGNLQGHREEVRRARSRAPRRGEGRGARADATRHALGARSSPRCQGLEERRVRAGPGQDPAQHRRDRARLPQHLPEVHGAGAAHDESRQWRQGHQLEHRARGEAARQSQLHREPRKAWQRVSPRSRPTSTPRK